MSSRTPLPLRVVAATLAALLAACSAPEVLRPAPAPNLPAAWKLSSAAGVDAANVQWQTYFTDPRLQALIALALVNSRDLQIAAARVQQGRADARSVDAERLPSVTGQLVQARSYTPVSLDGGTAGSRIDAQALLSYEVDFWGRVAALSDSAKVAFLASEESRRQVQLSLIADVANAYASLLEKDEFLELARTTLDLREQSLTIAVQAERAGGVAEDERQGAQAAVEQARGLLAQFEHLRDLAAHLLDFLVGTPPGELPPGKPLAEQQPGVVLATGLPSEVLLRRPDIRAAELRLAAVDADIDAARAAFLPKVTLTGALGLASPGLASLFSGGAWSYQPLLSLPIFDGGRAQANLDGVRARRIALVAEYEKAVRLAFREVADLLSARRSVRLQLDAAVATQRTQSTRLAIARARYAGGVASYREVLEAQRELLSARQTTISLRRAEQESAASLYKALGGGSDTAFSAGVAVAAGPSSHPSDATHP